MDASLLVSGALALVAAGLLAYLVIIGLKYQQEVGSMEIREAQLLQQCELNIRASDLAHEKTTLVLEQCRGLEESIHGLREQLILLSGARDESTEEKG